MCGEGTLSWGPCIGRCRHPSVSSQERHPCGVASPPVASPRSRRGETWTREAGGRLRRQAEGRGERLEGPELSEAQALEQPCPTRGSLVPQMLGRSWLVGGHSCPLVGDPTPHPFCTHMPEMELGVWSRGQAPRPHSPSPWLPDRRGVVVSGSCVYGRTPVPLTCPPPCGPDQV